LAFPVVDVSGAEPPSSLGKALKDLKQSRDTGTWAPEHRGRLWFENSLPVPFSLKPDGVGNIWEKVSGARLLRAGQETAHDALMLL